MKRLICALGVSLALAATVPLASAQSAPAATAKKAIPLSGKVLKTMDAGGYTYLLLDSGTKKYWVAVPQMKVAVGQKLTLIPGYEMKDFSSKALNKKFPSLIFSGGIANHPVSLSPSAMKMMHAGVPGADKNMEKAAKREAARHTVKVTPMKGPHAYTIAELYAKGSKLEKKPVVFRGQVVKVANHIMRKNWIHLEDGTGSAQHQTNDIVVTSTQDANIGDVITVTGTLYNNVDFGAGYKYRLIIQDAHLFQ